MADPTLQNGMTPGGTDKNGMAVASLVLGIIAVCCWEFWQLCFLF